MLSVDDLLHTSFTPAEQDELWKSIDAYYSLDEQTLITQFKPHLLPDTEPNRQAHKWIETERLQQKSLFAVDELMAKFGLNSDEGIVLLSLAEALLRIPDPSSATALIEDKLNRLDLNHMLKDSLNSGLLGTSSVLGIAISRQLISQHSANSVIAQLWERLGSATILKATNFAISHLGKQFVFAEDIQSALILRNDYDSETTAFSFDMLGEAALCERDVESYFNAYMEAIQSAGEQNPNGNTSISIKLSALHPRLENQKIEDIQKHLIHRLLLLLVTARNLDIAITIDAEESNKLELTLLIFEQLLRSELAIGWGKLGIAVQAYSKRALPVLRWLDLIAVDTATEIPIRLVKGAYWDTEIKSAQQGGISGYPVYTNKPATDLSYLSCAQYLLSSHCLRLTPQFATHNAQTIAYILNIKSSKPFEFQRLHGMGESLYFALQQEKQLKCRIYAPIGNQETLLPYLVRRLLENGANSSFMFQLNDPSVSIDFLTTPLTIRLETESAPHLPLPNAIYRPIRENASGYDLAKLSTWREWNEHLNHFSSKQWFSQPIIAGEICEGENLQPITPNYQLDKTIGYSSTATQEQIKQALNCAEYFAHEWKNWELNERCQILTNYALILEKHKHELICLIMLEAGKTFEDAQNELREAIDFCHYYAASANQQLLCEELISITGEENTLTYQGRGIFLCISPWNFPLAIFTGQIAAALVCGNTVLAKPSSSTPLIAFRATELWFTAGLPSHALQLIPCNGEQTSTELLQDSRVCGVTFTGSTQTAANIYQQLAKRYSSPIPTFIAETGGINTMIVDSTALPEQVVKDVIHSAFHCAGQRCSALRVLYVQDEIAELIEDKLIGAMNTLEIGSPLIQSTDIGAVINQTAMNRLYEHIERCRVQNKLTYELPLDDHHNNGYFVPPTLIKLHSLDELSSEVFGPVLHIIRYSTSNIERVLNEINRSGFGLTLGIHSRNDSFIDRIVDQVDVGNIYINRDQVGAVVASQPFGGMGMSGTGPKAGGPNYLKQFIREKTVTRNTTASGGNYELLSR